MKRREVFWHFSKKLNNYQKIQIIVRKDSTIKNLKTQALVDTKKCIYVLKYKHTKNQEL